MDIEVRSQEPGQSDQAAWTFKSREPVDRLRGTMEDMLNAGDNRPGSGSGRAGHSRFQRDWTANAFSYLC